jgi:hypothetical protein
MSSFLRALASVRRGPFIHSIKDPIGDVAFTPRRAPTKKQRKFRAVLHPAPGVEVFRSFEAPDRLTAKIHAEKEARHYLADVYTLEEVS